jgi:predicted DCC family thiol-disulfide oxidoreductase YuxK
MNPQNDKRDFEVFFDSKCPLCRREIEWLRRLDRQQRILFTDIVDPAFDPSSIGRTREELMAQIHGRLPNGEWSVGVETLRRLYWAVGFHKLVAFSRWPIVRQGLSVGYWAFAKIRPRLQRSGGASDFCPGGNCHLVEK